MEDIYEKINDVDSFQDVTMIGGYDNGQRIGILANPNIYLSGVKTKLSEAMPDNIEYDILAVSASNGNLSVTIEVRRSDCLENLVTEALAVDGSHHKQWYLHKIAERLGVEHPNDRFEEGVPP